jgi:hypothetical protein
VDSGNYDKGFVHLKSKSLSKNNILILAYFYHFVKRE